MMIFVMMIATFYINSYRIFKRYRADAALHWASSLAWYLMASVTVYLAGGSFIEIGFQPFLYNMLAAGIVLRECARKLETNVEPPVDALGQPISCPKPNARIGREWPDLVHPKRRPIRRHGARTTAASAKRDREREK